MREVGNDRLGLIFDADKLTKLDSLRQAAVDATVQPAHSAVNYSGSGTALMGIGNSGLLNHGVDAFLPGIAHEILPSSIMNAPQNLAAKAAVNRVLAAKGVPAISAPNSMVQKLGRALGTAGGATLAQQLTKPTQQ